MWTFILAMHFTKLNLTTCKVQLQHTCTSAGRRHTQISHVLIGAKFNRVNVNNGNY